MGKMKDISIELEEAGLDPLDNSNLDRYVDDTHHFGEDVLRDLYPIVALSQQDHQLKHFDMESGGLFSRHMIVNGRQLGRIHRQLERYSYSGRLVNGRLHYDVIDRHTAEVVNTCRQIKKAKALVKELNRG